MLRRLLQLTVIGLMCAAGYNLLGTSSAHAYYAGEYPADQSGAVQFANDYCVNSPYGNKAIADYMWITNPNGGSLTFNVVQGASQTVPVNINFFVTYCEGWFFDTTAYASSLEVTLGSSGSNVLRDAPGTVKYGNRLYPGTRETWGTWTSGGASLDLSGYASGTYWMCTQFATNSRWGKSFTPSPSACFNVTVNRVYPWDTGGMSQVGVDHVPNVQSWNAQPGQTVTWNHGIWNTTQYGTSQITAAVGRSGFRASSGLNGNQYPWWPGARFTLGPGDGYWFGNNTGNYNDNNFVYVLNQEDVGAGFNGKPAICQSASWGPSWYGYQNGEAWRTTSPACVNVPYKFNLTTQVVMGTTATTPGSLIGPINPYIDNSGPTKSYDGTAWQLSKFILPPGKAIPGPTTNASTPCVNYGNGCVSMGTGTGTFNPGRSLVGQVASYTVDDAPIGSRICFALSVNKYDQGQSDGKRWYHGAPQCVIVGKKPSVQVWGGDVAARANIDTSLTQKTNGVFGSWVEYGAFSVGTNSNFASGAGLAAQLPGSAMSSTAQGSWSKLTFADVDDKTPPNARYGQYAALASFRSMPNIAQYFAALSNGASAFNGNTPSGGGNPFSTGGAVQVRTAGDITLHKDTLTAGQSVVLIASGTVTIDGDLTYQDGPFTRSSQIPQLVIIAKAINITGGVQNIDAWLIATDKADGTINTCSDKLPTDPLTGNDCNQPLTIHGPVEARNLLLRRTYGSGTDNDSATPAEVIDMRADTYLWAQQVAAGAGKAKTVFTTELPPRF